MEDEEKLGNFLINLEKSKVASCDLKPVCYIMQLLVEESSRLRES